MAQSKPKVLVSNDDGINAPGIKALITELVKSGICDVYVCAPSGERSGQSHAITLGRYMSAAPAEVPGAIEAFAVDGTPADSVMLALHSPLLGEGKLEFDLVLSGINRGDNCGLHVIYSGTVGAAREAACKGVPCIAFSLDNHLARRMEDYQMSSTLAVTLVKGALGLLQGQSPDKAPYKSMAGSVVNVNFPIGQGKMLQGFYLTHQSSACVFPAFKEIQEASGPHLAEIEEHTAASRVFRNYAGLVQADESEGGDAWAVKNSWVSVTPLGLRQDVMAAHRAHNKATTAVDGDYLGSVSQVVAHVCAIMTAAAADSGLLTGGFSKL